MSTRIVACAPPVSSGVRMAPGQRALTRTPSGAPSIS